MPVHAFIFPGQGSQAVGMGRDLAAAYSAAREVFQEVDETLKQKLSKLMFEGPGEELTLTENTQPALMAHSMVNDPQPDLLEQRNGHDHPSDGYLHEPSGGGHREEWPCDDQRQYRHSDWSGHRSPCRQSGW